MARATKIYFQRVVVEGTGYFPLDMLRYDRCWPASEVESGRMMEVIGVTQEPVRITLLRAASDPTNGPTVGRWNSFSWHVIEWKNEV